MKTGYQQRAFTTVELIIVILVAGILAAVMLPRLNISSFRETGFAQQAMAAIRHAQKRAVSSGCYIDVSITTSGCSLQWNGTPGGCPASGTNISNPSTGLNNFCANSTAGGAPANNFTFDNIGRPSAAQAINLGTTTITVEAETGYAHE